MCRRLNNVTKDGKMPDIVFTIDKMKYALDVVYATDCRVAVSYNKKIEKYSPEFPNRVIPLVIKHNGEIYNPSMELLKKYVPEITEEYLCQIILYATVVYEATA